MSEVEVRAMFGSEFFDRSTSVLALVTVLLATLLLTARGLNFAVEFTGGMIIEVRYPEAPGSKSVQDMLVRAGFADASVKVFSAYLSYYIVLPTREGDLTPELEQRVAKQVIAALSTEQRHVRVSSIAVVTQRAGRETLLLGAVPLILACVAIMIHPAVCYGWRFALSIGVTNVRNMAIILGLFLSAYTVFEWEFSLPSLAAMDCLAILIAGVGAVCASRVSPS